MFEKDLNDYRAALDESKGTRGVSVTRVWLKAGVLTYHERQADKRILLAAELDDRDNLVKLLRSDNLRQTIKSQYGIDLK